MVTENCKATRAKFTLAEWIPPDEGGAKCWSLSLLSPTENQVFSLSLSARLLWTGIYKVHFSFLLMAGLTMLN